MTDTTTEEIHNQVTMRKPSLAEHIFTFGALKAIEPKSEKDLLTKAIKDFDGTGPWYRNKGHALNRLPKDFDWHLDNPTKTREILKDLTKNSDSGIQYAAREILTTAQSWYPR